MARKIPSGFHQPIRRPGRDVRISARRCLRLRALVTPARPDPSCYYFLEPSVAQPPLPLQEFLPLQPLSLALQPPLPLQEFWP